MGHGIFCHAEIGMSYFVGSLGGSLELGGGLVCVEFLSRGFRAEGDGCGSGRCEGGAGASGLSGSGVLEL